MRSPVSSQKSVCYDTKSQKMPLRFWSSAKWNTMRKVLMSNSHWLLLIIAFGSSKTFFLEIKLSIMYSIFLCSTKIVEQWFFEECRVKLDIFHLLKNVTRIFINIEKFRPCALHTIQLLRLLLFSKFTSQNNSILN